MEVSWQIWILFIVMTIALSCTSTTKSEEVDVIVIGAGAGAISAAISSSRLGSSTVLLSPIPWLGGMLSSAGVSAIDGNHEMRAGLYGEFREAVSQHYGGDHAIATGWVSHTLFEPSVADSILKSMATQEPSLDVFYNAQWSDILYEGDRWRVTYIDPIGRKKSIVARILIDGTDLGDVAAHVGAQFRLGMDSRRDTKESIAPDKANDIIQDLTYTAVLKDYGLGADMTMIKPSDYDPMEFDCACSAYCSRNFKKREVHPCETMLSYARLPYDKYLINWPREGNDYYINDVLLSRRERKEAYAEAKAKTQRFTYFIQDHLGYRHLGIADDEFPTDDRLPLMPYHREGRRIKGQAFMTLPHVTRPYSSYLYRTGIAVGDYPIDHHHLEMPEAPEIDFPLVPSFNIPLGTLIPEDIPNLLIADKAISVSNIVNGSTRLQPVIMQIGQAAGVIAALSIENSVSTHAIDVRSVQDELLNQGSYLMPYWDVKPDDPYFKAIQRIGASGILKGIGQPYKWANRTWFYPDKPVDRDELIEGLVPYYEPGYIFPEGKISKSWFAKLFSIGDEDAIWNNDLANIVDHEVIQRSQASYLLDRLLDPFLRPIDVNGSLLED